MIIEQPERNKDQSHALNNSINGIYEYAAIEAQFKLGQIRPRLEAVKADADEKIVGSLLVPTLVLDFLLPFLIWNLEQLLVFPGPIISFMNAMAIASAFVGVAIAYRRISRAQSHRKRCAADALDEYRKALNSQTNQELALMDTSHEILLKMHQIALTEAKTEVLRRATLDPVALEKKCNDDILKE